MKLATPSEIDRSGTAPGAVEALIDRCGPRPTVLAVWAHPDDESLLAGGLLAGIARRGGRVVNCCATLGEHGTDDPDRNPPAALARRRGRELADALEALGVEASHVLGWADGGCDRIPGGWAARRIARIVADTDPDLVVTFGPDGVTGHPDHRAVARWTDTAVARDNERRSRRGLRPIPLLTTAAGTAWPAEQVDRLHRIDAFWPGHPQRLLDDHHWATPLDDDLLEQKLAALAAHRSQIGPVADTLGPAGLRRLAAVEAYRPGNLAALRAGNPTALRAGRATDLVPIAA